MDHIFFSVGTVAAVNWELRIGKNNAGFFFHLSKIIYHRNLLNVIHFLIKSFS